jgi:hypothetical protein
LAQEADDEDDDSDVNDFDEDGEDEGELVVLGKVHCLTSFHCLPLLELDDQEDADTLDNSEYLAELSQVKLREQ